MDFTQMMGGYNSAGFSSMFQSWIVAFFGGEQSIGGAPGAFAPIFFAVLGFIIVFDVIDAINGSLGQWKKDGTLIPSGVHEKEVMKIGGVDVPVMPGVTQQGHLLRTGENLDGEDTFDIEGGRVALGGGLYASPGDHMTQRANGLKEWEFNSE